jgi:hypothetical protein
MPTELYFTRLITECRSALDRSRTGLLCRLGLRRRPDGDDDGVAGRLRPHYRVLAARGRVVWGAVAQVNMHLFSAGRDDLPGVTVYSLDGYYDAHPHDLAAIGLGAEEAALAAEKEGRRIAVEIQSFLGHSPVRSLEEAVGQYAIYRLLLAATDPGRVLYMAVSSGTYRGILAEPFGQLVVSGLNLQVVVFDEKQERIVQWIG